MDDPLAAVTIALVSIAAVPVGFGVILSALSLPPTIHALLVAIVPYPGVLVGAVGAAFVGAGVTGGIVAARIATGGETRLGAPSAE